MSLLHAPFRFLDPGSLVDRELELVVPQVRWMDDLLAADGDPLTIQHFPPDARVGREELDRFLRDSPYGHQRADAVVGTVPAYHFWMMLRHGPGSWSDPPRLRIAGAVSLRVGHNVKIEQFYGHLGYHVYPAVQGCRYAYRACNLLLPLARAHRMQHLWMTCDPSNLASRRTIERLGGAYVETVAVPQGDPLFARGETTKCRFKVAL